MASFGQQNQPIKATPAGYIDSDFIDGNDGSNIFPTWNATSFTALQNLQVGTSFSQDITTSFLNDPGSPAAQLGFHAVSGTDPVSAGFAFNGYVLSNPCAAAASGAFQIVAVRGKISALSPVYSYSISPPTVTTDTVPPSVPTGIAVAPGATPGTIALTFDAPSDSALGSVAASGCAHVDVLVNAAVASPPSPVTVPANALVQPTIINLGNISSPQIPTAQQDQKAWTLSAAGTGIAATTAEQCLLVDQGAYSGGQSFVAKLDSYTTGGTANTAFSGIVVHETATQGGRFLAVGLQPSDGATPGLYIIGRSTTGAASAQLATQLTDKNGQSITGPVYVRIQRAADQQTLTVSYSTNGLGWTVITTQVIAMVAAVHYAQIMASQTSGVQATAVVEELSLNNSAALAATITATSPVPIQLRAVDAAGNVSALSVTITGIPSVQTGAQHIVWKPMHIWKTGTDGSRSGPINGNLALCLQYMDAAVAADVNNNCGAFAFPFYLAALESPGGGVYDGSWDSSGNSGFKIVQALIAHAKAYNPPRSVIILLNLTGNGLSPTTSGLNTATYPAWFSPKYLSTLAGADGGCYWVGRGTGWAQAPIVTFWEPATAQRIVNLVQAYYNQFGPDTATGGIYMWDLTSELSIGNGSSWSTPLFISTCQNTLFPGVRAAAPRQMFFFRPTFLPSGDSNPNYYVQLLNAAQQYSIAFGNEDGTNTIAGTTGQHASFDWGAHAYCGLTVSNTPLGTPDQSTAGQMAFVFNVEDNEFGNVDNPIPPAKTGSGYFYNRSDYPGIFQGAVRVGASHIIWHIDNVYGPNLYRAPPQQTGTAPAAPTPGPNAGSKSARPDIFDLLTGNSAAYGSVGVQGPSALAIPRTAYPTLFP